MLMRINHDPVRTHRSAALGNAKAVSRLPPRLSSTTCSPSDGRHHVRAFPARSVSQLIQLVSSSPVFTRQSQFSLSTSVTTPVRIRLVIRRMISVNCAFIGKGCHQGKKGGSAATCISADTKITPPAIAESCRGSLPQHHHLHPAGGALRNGPPVLCD